MTTVGARATSRRRRAGRATNALLTLVACVGLVCVLASVASVTLGLQVALFRTGSMTPTISAGDAALTLPTEAEDIRVGDVVTVELPDQERVTHRVVATTGQGPTRDLVLKGDANAQEDPVPYRVTEVHRVVAVVPGVAPVLAYARHPAVLAVATAGATALVLWAFWPRPAGRRPTVPDHPKKPSSQTTLQVAGLLALAGPLGLGLGLAPDPGETVQGQYIRLTSITQPAMTILSPGDSASWTVGVQTDAPSPGTITTTLTTIDPVLDQLVVHVGVCPERPRDGSCPGGLREILPAQPLTSPTPDPLLTFGSDEDQWFVVTVRMQPDAPPDAQGASTSLTFGAAGFGEELQVTSGGGGPPRPADPLPPTGAGPGAATALALAATCTGALLLAFRRRRTTAPEEHVGTGGRR